MAQKQSRGIVFCKEMVEALLNTKLDVWPAEPIDASKPIKWQTRSVLKPQPFNPHYPISYVDPELRGDGSYRQWIDRTKDGKSRGETDYNTPFWRPVHQAGNVLYVREGRFMLKAEARIWLLVKGLRAERVQDISSDDCVAEGLPYPGIVCGADFAFIWDRLNEKRGYSYASNPWVWVYEFQRISKPEGWDGDSCN